MKDKNVFYIKNIVDGKITEETPRVKTQKIVEETNINRSRRTVIKL